MPPSAGTRLVQAAAPLLRIVRIALNGEIAFERARPALDIDGAAITAPPGVFVQAVAEAEQMMANAILRSRAQGKAHGRSFLRHRHLHAAPRAPCPRARRRLRPPRHRRSRSAARQAPGLKPIEARVRDLFRDPLSPRELDGFDAVVFDPPYAGAKAQAEALARGKVPVIAAVSCNPATLARDLRILIDGGYRLGAVIPIDQFLYAAHVEVVAILRRGALIYATPSSTCCT